MKIAKLILSIAVVLIAMLSISAAEAGSLNKGEEFKSKDGGVIRVVSSDEVEIGRDGSFLLGKYTNDGERLRVVTSQLGSGVVQYFKISQDGLVEDNKDGIIFFSKASLEAQNVALREQMRKAEAEKMRTEMMIDNRNGTTTHVITNLMWQQNNNGQRINWRNAINYCQDLMLAGYSDWRLPEQNELKSLFDILRSNNIAMKIYFPALKMQGTYWSATTVTTNNTFAKTNSIGDFIGFGSFVKTFPNYALCVRLGNNGANANAASSSRNINSTTQPSVGFGGASGNIDAAHSQQANGTNVIKTKFTLDGGEAIDKDAGLIWRRCAEGMEYSGGTCTGTARKFTCTETLQRATDQANRTGKAWRVPSDRELASIVDKNYGSPMIDHSVFPVTPAADFWTAESMMGPPGQILALSINFDNGEKSASNCPIYRFVRLVRAAK